MALLFHATGWPREEWLEELAQQAPWLDVRTAEDLGDPRDITHALVWKPPADLLAGLPSLRLIISAGAGVDHLLSLPGLPDVPVSRVVDPDLTRRMGEYVAQQALMHLRRQREYDACQKRREWCSGIVPPTAPEVTCGIMGLGALGAEAARLLRLLGFRVTGWARTRRYIEGMRCFAGAGELEEFLAGTDILVCLLPLTPETEGILNIDLFRRLRHDGALGGPILINAGRGRLQKDADILAALEEGTLKAASLDVFETEPLPEESPLWDHPAVTVTPHVAAVSSPRAVVAYALRQIARMERGEAPENLVERARGY